MTSKRIIALAGAFVIGFASAWVMKPTYQEVTYNRLAQVMEANTETGLCAAVTVDGDWWEFYADDVEVGDEIDLKIHNNWTPYYRFDDSVIYCIK